jgi:biotin transport system substrate-specific component
MHNVSAALLSDKEIIRDRTATKIIGVTAFALLTWLGAHVFIPLGFTPVPITLQTLFVFLSGAMLGKKLGAISQITYLSMGIIGLPFFTGGGFGPLYIMGPTGGYILGFIAASYSIGCILKQNTSTGCVLTAFLAGAFIIFACGAGWLIFGLGFGIKEAMLLGVLPFMPGCIIKIALATIITKNYLKRARAIFS